MDKQERKLKGQAKFKKRFKNFCYNVGGDLRDRTINVLKSTGTPCSCAMCSPGKVEEKEKYRLNKFNKNKLDE